MAFSSDGAKMFVVGYSGDDVNEYALSAAFDASTATFVDAFSVSSQETSPRDMAFSSDGSKMFVVGLDGDGVNEYALSAAFDASTAVFVDAFPVSSQETEPTGMAFSSDGAKMFVVGLVGDDVNEYDLHSVYPITVTGQANAAPVLGAIGAKSVDELATLSFTATATDGDSDPLEFSLVGTPPSGASINSTSGAFSWTPSESQDDTHTITIQVEDGNGGSDSEAVTVTVNEVNADPVLASVGSRNVDELESLTFTATASDGDVIGGTADSLEFTLAGTPPSGASINQNTGAFSWTPSESQDGMHTITIQVEDGAGATDSEAVTVTVSEVNEDPVLNPIGPKSVNQLEALTFTATASDGDVIGGTADTLEFSLGAGAPTGASINSATGAFSWTPTASQVGEHTVTVVVTDGSSATDSEAVTVTVTESSEDPDPPLTFVSSGLDGATGVLTITFSEEIDATPATNVVPARIHIRESGSYTGGTTLAAGELDTTADGATISFTLTAQHLTEVAGLATPELTIEPGAVRDTSANLIDGTFDVSTAVFVDATSVLLQENNPRGMAFSSDGTKMFVVGTQGDDVNEYTLSTAFDASTATFVDAFSVSSQDLVPTGMAFSNDGTKMFVVGFAGRDINEYTLSTAFDVSTAAFVNNTSVGLQESQPQGMAFSNDGTKMFVTGGGGDDINEYALSTAFDASTATFADAFSVSPQETSPTGMAFSNDGTKMFVVGIAGDKINEYALSTAFDVSTAAFADVTFSVSSQEAGSQGMAFSNDGAKMFVIGNAGDDVNEYALSSVYPITVTGTSTPPADSTPPTFVSSELDSVTGVLAITFSEEIDATPATSVVPAKIHIRESGSYTGGTTLAAGELGTTADGATISFTLTAQHLAEVAELAAPELTIEPGAVRDTSDNLIVGTFDASTAVFVDAFSVSSEETVPTGMAFSNDGAKMFVTGFLGEDINEYMLSTAFDASTATFVDAFSVSSQDSIPAGMAFSSDGTKMFVVGNTGNDINEYALSTAFDVSTATFVDAFSVSSQETDPTGMAFSNDGTKMFVIGNVGDDVNEYALSTAFDASTATFVDAFSVSPQETSPTGMAFSNDGTKMFVVGIAGNKINEYALSAAFDASTAAFADVTFSVSSQEAGPQGMAFSSDGAKMFVVGAQNDRINEYTLSSVYPITVTGQANAAPVLGAIGAKSVDELATLSFTATATDGDSDPLEFSLVGTPPSGASINSTSGAFSWTPSESQDDTHTITIQVEDGNGGSDSEAVTVTVNEVNADPVLASVGSRNVDELESLTFTATASDGDVIGGTADSLEFTLAGSPPSGASITSSGSFSWTPSESQDGMHTITIQVEDVQRCQRLGGRHGDGKRGQCGSSTGIHRLQERQQAGGAHVHGHGLRRRRHRGDGRYPGVLPGCRRPDGRLHKFGHRRVLVDAYGKPGGGAHRDGGGHRRQQRDRL